MMKPMSETERLKWLIREVLMELPTKRDWLNPELERMLREVVK